MLNNRQYDVHALYFRFKNWNLWQIFCSWMEGLYLPTQPLKSVAWLIISLHKADRLSTVYNVVPCNPEHLISKIQLCSHPTHRAVRIQLLVFLLVCCAIFCILTKFCTHVVTSMYDSALSINADMWQYPSVYNYWCPHALSQWIYLSHRCI